MTAQQLKNSILQMAVQGKLVPQDPNDEPASILLERIRAEKEKLIKEGKIKKEKNPSVIIRGEDNLPYEKVGNNEPVCIADEVPFDIPESWEWVRLSTLSSVVTKGTTPRGGNVAYLDRGIGFLRAENIAGFDHIDTNNMNYIDEATHNGFLKRSILESNDILITIAGTLGRTAIVKKENLPLNANQAVSIVRLIDATKIDIYFIICALNSPFIQKSLTVQKKITAIPNLTLEIISDCFIPVPPLAEQHRIVEAYQQFIPFFNDYETIENQLRDLNLDFPAKLKKSILQQAVMGKLVPQDENDEPASVLLDRIRAEKQALIKAGKLKKDKHESLIYRRDNSHYEKLDGVERCIDDEIPYDIPVNWAWCRIKNIFNLQAGKNIQASQIHDATTGNDYPCYGGNGIRGYADSYNHDGDYPIIGRQGALCGNINRATGKFYATEHAVCVDMYADTNVSWACLFLTALNLNQYATATAQPGLAVANINEVLIPVPPLPEQRKIVEKTSSLMGNLRRF